MAKLKKTVRKAFGFTLAQMLPLCGYAGVPSFQELMNPAVLPQPQLGMVVESAILDKNSLVVVTTGARIDLNQATGEILFQQRIGHQRPVARLRLGVPLQGGRLTHKGSGFALVAFEQPKLTIRVNGDSLFMLQAHEALTMEADRLITPAWDASFQTNHLLADEWGGFGLYCSEEKLGDHYSPSTQTVARYELPADAVLWVSVCPPKPYNWKRSFKDTVIWHWSDKLAYPPDDVLKSWKDDGNIVLLQSEVMAWKDWNLDFVPRLGHEEFARVRKTLHDNGMRFMVYTSPAFFLKGTQLEKSAFNSFDNFERAKGFPLIATTNGENIDLFMEAITRVMKADKPDGLYFDGQYSSNPAALYLLARRTRALLGEDGILEWHSTNALGTNDCYLPQADAYVDFILRGETMENRYKDLKYLRFFVSGYNIHNSIGVMANNASVETPRTLVDEVLKVNARFHHLVGREDWMKIRGYYQSRLTPSLRELVDKEVDLRQEQGGAAIARKQQELALLSAEPAWGNPVFREDFNAMPANAKPVVSPKNNAPFTVSDGVLRIRAYTHTYAFLSLPLPNEAQGLVIRLRQGTDSGMSWGPGAALRFANGALLRLGARADNSLQADILGKQSVGGSSCRTDWVWLRVRWLKQWGVVECSHDGKRFTPVWTFEHDGIFNQPAAELLFGKVPYTGSATDYSEIGDTGECEIDSLSVY